MTVFKRILVYIIAALLIIPVQSLIFGFLHLVKPDGALLIAFFAGLMFGEMEGVIVGAAFGLIIDVFYGGMLGLNFFTKAMTGYIAGSLGRNFQNITITFVFISVFILSSIELLISYSLFAMFYKNAVYNFNDILRETIFPSIICTTLASVAAFFALLSKNYEGTSVK